MVFKFIIPVVLFSLIIACTKSNSLLGAWVLDTQGLVSSNLSSDDAKYELTFSEHFMMIGGKKIAVEYKIKDAKTTVIFSDGYISNAVFSSTNSITFKTLRSARKYVRK
jgi:hypothetical protein